jgi:hypothetical protein
MYQFAGVPSHKKDRLYQAQRLNISQFLRPLKSSNLFIIFRVIFISRCIFPLWWKRTTLEPENASTGFCTRHVDTRYHFVQEFIVGGFIKIKFVRSIENDSDLFTKNINQELYAKHTKNFLEDSGVHSTGWSLQDRKGARDILCNQHFSFTRLRIIH